DKDGTPDKTDLCPDVPGDKNHYGCPDTDGDGTYDNEDKCIQTAGPKDNLGCPFADKDNDGVFDKDDACPTIPGIPENKGCPKLEKKELETIKYAFENLEFETGKDIIRSSSFPSLNSLASLLVKKPNYGLKIEGHTDNVGSDEKNMILSQKRADAVKKYLTKKGVKADYLDTYGYGETKPIATNETPQGRQKNRRVEMTVTFH
ncbi:MAG TPA: OmpA family protein, partial [Chitinophagales bacterium]|nr:OmpA family protein [Chitinophagales bacterium]